MLSARALAEKSADMPRRISFWLAEAGVRDPFEPHRKRPLAEHLEDWLHALRAFGTVASRVALVEATVPNARRAWSQSSR
ncbi:MAG: hypothetical protein HRJ53_14570, partial [Acidobacteria bacterium Pan2503]|nr:hypothetical protein [Candidatus Acidoferrum panamensis]